MFQTFKKYYFILCIFFSFAIHCVSSYFSIGFYSQDEHFQILSPVEYLLGINNSFLKDIWEFTPDYRIRPWFQSYIYFYMIKILNIFEIDNPFFLTFILRFFSSLLGFFSLLYFYLYFRNVYFKDTLFNKTIILLFFFYPYLHARTSSENIGTSIFIFGLISFHKIFLSDNNSKYLLNSILCGFLLGLAIIVRYQFLIFVFALFTWITLFYLSFYNIKKLFLIGLFILLVLIIGLIFDSSGYGSFNFTYYNYFYVNFIEGMLDFFGSDPWWYYFYITTINFAPPIGLIFLLGLFILTIKKFNNILVFISIFYFLTFCFISHKELRFLFPLFFFSPFIICIFLENIKNVKITKTLKYLIIIPNFIFLFVLSIIPATEQVKVYKFIYENNIKKNLYYLSDNPYIIAGLNPKLYTSHLPKISRFEQKFIEENNYYIVLNDYNDFQDFILNKNCKKKYSVYPEIVNKNPNWRKRKFNWYILYCINNS